jgi:hypothetical protein
MKSKGIETARAKEVTKEQILHFNEELRRVIQEHNIQLKNTYNADETGTTMIIYTDYRLFNWNNAKSTSGSR